MMKINKKNNLVLGILGVALVFAVTIKIYGTSYYSTTQASRSVLATEITLSLPITIDRIYEANDPFKKKTAWSQNVDATDINTPIFVGTGATTPNNPANYLTYIVSYKVVGPPNASITINSSSTDKGVFIADGSGNSTTLAYNATNQSTEISTVGDISGSCAETRGLVYGSGNNTNLPLTLLSATKNCPAPSLGTAATNVTAGTGYVWVIFNVYAPTVPYRGNLTLSRTWNVALN